MTPFDVVKTRLQSGTTYAGGNPPQIPLPTTTPSLPYRQIHECCREVFFGNPVVVCRFQGELALEGCGALPASSSASAAGFQSRTFPATSAATGASSRSAHDVARIFTGTMDGMIKIARYEGIPSLFSGLSPTLWVSLAETRVSRNLDC